VLSLVSSLQGTLIWRACADTSNSELGIREPPPGITGEPKRGYALGFKSHISLPGIALGPSAILEPDMEVLAAADAAIRAGDVAFAGRMSAAKPRVKPAHSQRSSEAVHSALRACAGSASASRGRANVVRELALAAIAAPRPGTAADAGAPPSSTQAEDTTLALEQVSAPPVSTTCEPGAANPASPSLGGSGSGSPVDGRSSS